MSTPKRQHPIYLGLIGIILIAVVVGVLMRHKWKNPTANLILASGQEGGVYVELAKEFEKLIETQLPGIGVIQKKTFGSVNNVDLITSGNAHLALVQNDIPGSAELRTVAPLHRDYLHFLVRKDSKISGIRDLKGKTVTTGLVGSGSLPIVEALIDYFGVTGETKIQNMSTTDGIAALENGETHALLLMLGFRAPAIMNIVEKAGDEIVFAKLPPIEIEALKGFVLSYPICETIELPPFAYGAAPKKAVTTMAVQTVLVADKDVPNQVIKSITEVLFTHRSELIHQHPAAAQMTEAFSESSVSFPIHPGAHQYFSRDEPGFIMRYAEAMAFVLSLMLASYGLFTATKKWMSQKQKDRIDDYYILVEEYIGQLESVQKLTPSEIDNINKSLGEIRHAAYTLLAGEKLIPDASFRILQHLLEQCEHRVREYQN